MGKREFRMGQKRNSFTETQEVIICNSILYLINEGNKIEKLCKENEFAKKLVNNFISLLEKIKTENIKKIYCAQKEIENLIKSMKTIH